MNVHTFEEHYESIWTHIQSGKNFYPFENSSTKRVGFIAYTNQYFFNKLTVGFEEKDKYFLISKEHPAKTRITTFQEVESVINSLVKDLDPDLDGKTFFEEFEFTEEDWDGRRWNNPFCEIRFRRFNGWFQMFFYIHRKKNRLERILEWAKKIIPMKLPFTKKDFVVLGNS